MVVDRDSDRPRLTERDFDSMSRAELWLAYQKLERLVFSILGKVMDVVCF